jgi:hypothetical protein
MRNAKAAMLAAIELYNKPNVAYRDESVAILLLNGWELLLKALLSKNKQSIFYPKQRGSPYRSLSWQDALKRAESFFPKDVGPLPIRRNLDLISTYRDNAVHFYNATDFRTILYSLAQTSIVNFKDLLERSFDVDLGKEITWVLLPLGLHPPIDPVTYMSKQAGAGKTDPAVRQFLAELATAVAEIEAAGGDTGRLLTAFSIKLESTKKIEKADLVVGVEKAGTGDGPLTVVKTMDPNVTHPLRQKEVVDRIGTLAGRTFTSHTFQAIVYEHRLKQDTRYCWQAKEGVLTRYSNDVVALITHLADADVQRAIDGYHRHLKKLDQRN